MKKTIKIFLYTDDLKIIDAVFGCTLKRNIVESCHIELFRKREMDALNSILSYDLIIMDDSINECELARMVSIQSLPTIFRVIRDSEKFNEKLFDTSCNLEFDKLKNSLHRFLSVFAN